MNNKPMEDKRQEHGTSMHGNPYYMCICPECGWFGSSEDIIGGEETCDCPNCYTEVDYLGVEALWNIVLPKLIELEAAKKCIAKLERKLAKRKAMNHEMSMSPLTPVEPAQSEPCARCGRTTSHPEGHHYCHKKDGV